MNVDSFPAYIGSKQFDISHYPLRPFYVFDLDETNITKRVRGAFEDKGEELTAQELQAAVQLAKDKILSHCPLTVSIVREDYAENKEKLSIDSIFGDDGEELNNNDFKLEVQSLNDPDCYWLDSGEFNINIVANNREIAE